MLQLLVFGVILICAYLTTIYSASRRGGRVIKDIEFSDVRASRLPDIHLSTTIITSACSEPTGNIEGEDAKNPKPSSQEDRKQNPKDPKQNSEGSKQDFEDPEETLGKEAENYSIGKLAKLSIVQQDLIDIDHPSVTCRPSCRRPADHRICTINMSALTRITLLGIKT